MEVINQHLQIGQFLYRTSLAWKKKFFSFLWQKLYKTSREMQERIMDLLIVVENEDVTMELIQVNEDLNNALLGCERWADVYPPQPPPSLVPPSPVAWHSYESAYWVNIQLGSRTAWRQACLPSKIGNVVLAFWELVIWLAQMRAHLSSASSILGHSQAV